MAAVLNYRLLLAYDGTDYHGFQRQAGGLRTIQGELERALQTLYKRPIRMVGAGRTDAGVHARGQVVNFLAPDYIPVDRLPYAVNACLDRDIVVFIADKVPRTFSARKSATAKLYSYSVTTTEFADPFLARYSWHRPGCYDLEVMAEAARLLVGTHDFKAFSKAGSSAKTTVRTIKRLDVAETSTGLRFEVCANGFLYGMVRLIVGSLLEVGQGRLDPGAIERALTTGRRGTVGATAGPSGLCLEKVFY